jgi:hypothetical protein
MVDFEFEFMVPRWCPALLVPGIHVGRILDGALGCTGRRFGGVIGGAVDGNVPPR